MKFLRLGKFYININNIESINYSMLYEKHIIYFNTASCTYIVKIELNDLFIDNIKAAYSEIIENINKIIEKGMYVNLNEKYNFNVIKIKEIKDK